MPTPSVPARRVSTLVRDRLALAPPPPAELAAGPAAGIAHRHALSDLVDAALRELFDDAVAACGIDGTGVALAVVGSAGRRDAGPCSDLDCLLVHDGRTLTATQVEALATALWYPIWDAGLKLDHSVRTLAQCRQIASADLPAAVGLLDIRHVAGDPLITHRAASAVLEDWRRAARRRLGELLGSVERRADRFGELAYLIAPDLKESRGGLRDAVVIDALVASWLTDRPHGPLDDARAHLLDVRDALHRTTRRPSNRLVLAEHDDVAALLGLQGGLASTDTGADELLASCAQSARVVTAALDATVRRARQALRRPSLAALRGPVVRGRRIAPRLRTLAEGLVEHDGEVVLAIGADPSADPCLALRAAATSARTGLPIAPPTLTSLSASAPLPEPWPADARQDLLDVLASGRQVAVLEELDLAGLLTRWIPEWALVRNRPQRAAIHRHTVDRHLVEASAEAARLAPRLRDEDRTVLLLAALLHDIGKVPGALDHSEAGAAMVPAILARMGLAEHVADVEFLVRHHLLLAETATTEDPGDVAVADRLAAVVGTRRRLALLATLTEADARAVGERAWSEWRAQLVGQLAESVGARLGVTLGAAHP
ncbi:MAG: HD domain-containing protein [Actinobacteria bacterium]|nr:HD domain-containing protein [Actinomycetota bacterium]